MPEVTNANEAKWIAQFESVLEHMKENDGDIPYPRKGQEANLERMGQWVSKQRKLYRTGVIEESRKQRLLAVPGLIIARQYAGYAAAVPDAAELETVRTAIKVALSSSEKTTFTADEAFEVIDGAINELVAP